MKCLAVQKKKERDIIEEGTGDFQQGTDCIDPFPVLDPSVLREETPSLTAEEDPLPPYLVPDEQREQDTPIFSPQHIVPSEEGIANHHCDFNIYDAAYLVCERPGTKGVIEIELIRVDENTIENKMLFQKTSPTIEPRHFLSFFKKAQLLLIPPILIATVPLLYYACSYFYHSSRD